MDRSTRHHQVSQLDEFALIDVITQGLPTSEYVTVGVGDDAAVVTMQPSGSTVVCTDMLVEGRHFRTNWSTAEDVGHRAAAANLADIAAMGARPRALLVALGLPDTTEAGWVADLIDGIQAEAESIGAVIAGGDTNSTDGPIVLSVTAIGDLGEVPPVRRSGAAVGDQVAIAGRQGWAAAGLAVLSRGFRSPRLLVDAVRRPDVPYSAGPAAAAAGATAMIDVSDGLLADLGHIADASGVRIDIDASTLPVDPVLRDTAIAFSVDQLSWVLTGGDDHALVATFPKGVELPGSFVKIGSVVDGPVDVVVDGGQRKGSRGWQHFHR